MKIKKWVDDILYVILAILMALMVVNVLWQVASRYILGSPSSFTDELSRYLLIWVSLLGASYVSGKKLHLAIDLLPLKLHGKKALRLNIFINSIVAVFAFFVLIWGGINLVYITLTLEQTSAALNVPLGYVYAVLPISGVLIIFYSMATLFEKKESPEEQGKEIF